MLDQAVLATSTDHDHPRHRRIDPVMRHVIDINGHVARGRRGYHALIVLLVLESGQRDALVTKSVLHR